MRQILSKWQIDVLEQLIDQYENSKTYRGENRVVQVFSIVPEKVFWDYNSDYADINLVHDFEHQMKEIEKKGFISIIWKNNTIEKLVANTKDWDLCYKILGRKERRKLELEQIELYRNYLDNHKMMDCFCQEQMKRLEAGKKTPFTIEEAEKILKLWKFLLENQEEVLERELSIAVLGDSKLWEKKYRSKVCRLLRTYGDFDEVLLGVDDEREAEKIILGEYQVESNPSFVYFKGDAKLQFKDGQTLKTNLNMPVAFNEETLSQIKMIRILTKNVMTVENLTSFNRLRADDSFYIFLSGYHNRLKQKLLCKIYEDNNLAEWYHFGDIDPDGFYIIEHLIKGTGIPFKPLYMEVAYLKKYDSYTKPLNKNDIRKAQDLLQQRKYNAIMDYMLSENKKLEQEIISWKEQF